MNELTVNKNVERAIMEINGIKANMIIAGNEISLIVYSIREELKERNACKLFAEKTGMSKASISKMLMAETLRGEIGIDKSVSYNAIYKVKDLFSISSQVTERVVNGLELGVSEKEIRNSLGVITEVITEDLEESTEIAESTETEETEDVEETAKDIKAQIIDIIKSYEVSSDDMKLIKMLLKSLR